jgi:hypothetical protein
MNPRKVIGPSGLAVAAMMCFVLSVTQSALSKSSVTDPPLTTTLEPARKSTALSGLCAPEGEVEVAGG